MSPLDDGIGNDGPLGLVTMVGFMIKDAAAAPDALGAGSHSGEQQRQRCDGSMRRPCATACGTIVRVNVDSSTVEVRMSNGQLPKVGDRLFVMHDYRFERVAVGYVEVVAVGSRGVSAQSHRRSDGRSDRAAIGPDLLQPPRRRPRPSATRRRWRRPRSQFPPGCLASTQAHCRQLDARPR